MSGIVAIVGRPNVGKSTLFNRLIEQRKSIVDDHPGVTRDRIYGTSQWNGREFNVIDTGGYVPESSDVFEAAIREQVEIALQEADVIIFMADVSAGLIPHDEEIAQIIRRHNKKEVVVAVNKADNHNRSAYSAEFYSLGLDVVVPISAINGSGTGDLLDEVVKLLPPEISDETPMGTIARVAIVGRPNVGKSSLVNALIGKNQNIVTPVAGTTRDSIYTHYKEFGLDFYLIDTAGLRRKAKVDNNIEYYSAIRTVKAIEECDVALLMVDAQTGLEAQDLHILKLIEKHKKGLAILLNKWDLVEKVRNVEVEIRKNVEERILPLTQIPILFVSATEKTRLVKAMQTAQQIFEEKKKIITTRDLNEALLPIIQTTPPPSESGKMVRIKFVTQVEGATPTFLFFANHPTLVKESYKRFLENQIRNLYGFAGCQLNIFFRQK